VLEQGGTVVVPSRQRAVAVRLIHTRARLRAGAAAWKACDVLPYGAWLARLAAQARHGALRGLRRLGATEEWLLWRAAAAEACEGTEVLQPSSLADALRRSAALCRDWALHWPGDPTPEATVLARARARVERRCRELQAYAADDWTRILAEAPALPQPVLFAGCEAFGPALRSRLRELGAEFFVPVAQPLPAALPTACVDATDELRRAAQWCRAGLERNPAARFLVVVPDLSQRRAAAVTAFEHELAGGALLAPAGDIPYVIEGGRSLAEYPMVRTALALLRLAGARLEFAELAPLLRSPYWSCGSPSQRAALELALRHRNVAGAELRRLAGLAHNLRGGHAPLAAALESLAAATGVPRGWRATPAGWARRFAEALDAFAWPGAAALGSDEEQQRERFRALLGELAMVGAGAGAPLGHAEAVRLLANMAQRTAFESASEDVPVTLTESTGDPLVPYEGIWVTSLGAERWPAAPRPDPFIPIAVQRAAGLPQSSAPGQLGQAQQALAAWARCAGGRLVLSWPGSDGDVALQPSSLVAAGAATPPPLADPLLAALRRAVVREPRAHPRALAWQREQPLPGGTRTLELQSLCPFRAAAELRLGAAPVAEPVPGLDRRERGQVLHHALQRLWQGLRDSRTLRERAADAPALAQRVRGIAEASLREQLALRPEPLPAPLVDNELRRLVALVTAMLEQELERSGAADFSVLQLEQAARGALAGVPLRVRMDRLDRLDDGRLIVIDYKSGQDEAFQPLADRPRQPQLLAYALLAAEVAAAATGEAGEAGATGAAPVAGVAAVYLRADAVRWRGAVADPALLPPLKPPKRTARSPVPPWGELQVHWRMVIERLVNQFVAGDADVDPRRDACRNCHLSALCRVDAAVQVMNENALDDEGEATDAS